MQAAKLPAPSPSLHGSLTLATAVYIYPLVLREGVQAAKLPAPSPSLHGSLTLATAVGFKEAGALRKACAWIARNFAVPRLPR